MVYYNGAEILLVSCMEEYFMSYQIRYLENQNILETICEGDVSVPNIIAAIQKNLDLSKKHRVNLFLVDCTFLVDEKKKVFENYEVGTFMADMFTQLPRKFRDAIVTPKNDIAIDNLRFFETVARNRGLNVRVFETRDDALGWLLSA